MLQTNLHEIKENFQIYIGVKGVLFALLFIIATISPVFLKKNWLERVTTYFSRFGYVRYVILLPAGYVIVFFINAALNYGFYNVIVKFLPNTYSAYKTVHDYQNKLQLRQQAALVQRDEMKNLTVILVIGESATSAHMSAYGYYRKTTPWMEQAVQRGESILFSRAFSAHSHTSFTVPLMISTCSQYQAGDIADAPTIVNLFSSKGYGTWWISNQERQGIFTNFISVLGEEAQHVFFSGNTESRQTRYDEVLLPKIEESVKTAQQGKLIVVHFMGSHGRYADRYPETFQPQLGELVPGLWGIHEKNKQDEIHTYDISIAYTDTLLQKITRILPQDQNIVLIYVGDHGEDVVGSYYHDSARQLRHDMFSIPFMIWGTQYFRKHNKELWDSIEKIKDLYITNDRVSDIIKMIESETCNFDSLVMKDAGDIPIRNGEYSVSDITCYKVAENVNRLKKLTKKHFLLHRTDTLEKAAIAQRSGFDGVEIDVVFDPKKNMLMVGHDSSVMSGLSLEIFLSSMKKWDYSRLWLDIKNCNSEYAGAIFSELDRLNSVYNFKMKSIIETGYPGVYIEKYKNNGWFISYYAPTPRNGSTTESKQICQAIETAREQYIPSGISFDIATYEQANAQCPKVFSKIPLNTWAIRVSDIASKNSITSTLLRHNLMAEPSLDCILLSMETDANL
ncbi:MAG: phosphoethanolamine transferase [Desulfovibrionaceae bacterium]|nr:phosphoethanolamine transferase [Desulfovibrionaceae bacterium]